MTTTRTRLYRPHTSPTVAVALGLAFLVFFVWAIGVWSYDAWAAFFVIPVLGLITVPIITREARSRGDFDTVRLLEWALAYKLLGTFLRFFVIEVVYKRAADASQYNGSGRRLSELFRQGDFTVDLGHRILGTGFIEIVTGLIYAITRPTKFGGFLVFSWFSFIGLFLLYRAFCIAMPDGDRRRYLLVLFFFPSMAFWPSSLGKEAWMLFTIGVGTYGAAKILAQQRGGFLFFALGLAGSAACRPHLTLIMFVSLCGAYLVRRPKNRSAASPLAKAFGVLLLLAIGVLVVNRVEAYFNLDTLQSGGVSTVLDRTEGQTDQGDSSFQAARPNNALQLPMAFVTVMFRPFPHEAGSVQGLIAATEGLLLLIILARSWRRIGVALRRATSEPYLLYCGAFVLLFVFAFSSVGNFGLLARQRVQVLPFLLVFVAVKLPPVGEWRQRAAPQWSSVPTGHGGRWGVTAPKEAPEEVQPSA